MKTRLWMNLPRKSRHLGKIVTILTLVVSIAIASPAQAVTLPVNINDLSCDDSLGTTLFCSIGAALNAALPEDIIQVAGGVYFEGISIDINNVAVIGQGRPVIDGNDVAIRADGVTFSGFDIRNGGTIVMLCTLTCRGNLITANRILGGGNLLGGISIVLSDSNVISHNRVNGNIGPGIYVDGSASNNMFLKNVVTRNPVGGFLILGSRNRFTKNKATRNGMDGFWVASPFATFNTFNRNIAMRNQFFGFRDDNTSGAGTSGTANRYKKNICKKNGRGGSSPDSLCKPQ